MYAGLTNSLQMGNLIFDAMVFAVETIENLMAIDAMDGLVFGISIVANSMGRNGLCTDPQFRIIH